MNEADALDALKRLGLTTYEAGVFVALQRLEVGTAREVAQIADVPRSQVYGAAEDLEDRGLVETQQTKPRKFRAVSLEEAQDRLRAQRERDHAQAFDYLETVQRELTSDEEQTEDIWTVRGRTGIGARIAQLIEGADERVVFAASHPTLVTAEIFATLEDRAAEGVEIVGVSANADVRSRFAELSDATVEAVPNDREPEVRAGHLLIADGEAVLISLLDEGVAMNGETETAIWSDNTGFARVLIALIDSWFGDLVDV